MIIFECHIIDIAPTISRLLNVPMIPPTGKTIPEVLKYTKKKDYKRVVIIIVDSLGYSLYMHLFPIMKNLNELVEKGLLFKCRSPATITSPAIASIFTGYPPDEHKIYSTADIYAERAKDSENPKLKSIMEWAYLVDMNVSVVIESILDYDRQITKYAVYCLKEKNDILAVHLRTLDRFFHRAKNWEELKNAAKEVDKNLGKIFRNSEKGTIFFICGDHAIHGEKKWLKDATEEEIKNYRQNLVALIVSYN